MNQISSPKHSAVNETIDRLSLEQALLDAELAIGRSRDLMLRLVELSSHLAEERMERHRIEAERDEAQRLYEAIQVNRAYKMAAKLWALRRAVGA